MANTDAKSRLKQVACEEDHCMENKSNHLDWKEEIERFSILIKEHWAVLGVAILVLSVVAMWSYLTEEGIPLSIASPAIIAGLPVIFALVAYSVAVLAAAAAMPAMILLGGSPGWSWNLMDEFERYNGKNFARRLVVFWVVAVFVTTLIFLLILSRWNVFDFLGVWGLTVFAVFLFSLSGIVVVAGMAPGVWWAFLKSRWFLFLLCSLVQLLVVSGLVAAVDSRNQGDVEGALLTLALSIPALSFFQVISVCLARRITKEPGLLIVVIGGAFAIMMMVCMTPPLNRFFVGFVLGSSATGGRGCVVFEWAKGAEILAELKKKGNTSSSIDLNVPIATQDRFYVKPASGSSADDVFLVPYSAVAKVSRCQRKKIEATD